MRNSLGAPHSTERCKVSKNIWNTQINAKKSFMLFMSLGGSVVAGLVPATTLTPEQYGHKSNLGRTAPVPPQDRHGAPSHFIISLFSAQNPVIVTQMY